jgi:hypothetical protein
MIKSSKTVQEKEKQNKIIEQQKHWSKRLLNCQEIRNWEAINWSVFSNEDKL